MHWTDVLNKCPASHKYTMKGAAVQEEREEIVTSKSMKNLQPNRGTKRHVIVKKCGSHCGLKIPFVENFSLSHLQFLCIVKTLIMKVYEK